MKYNIQYLYLAGAQINLLNPGTRDLPQVQALRIICANFKEGTPVQLLRDYARFVNMNQMLAASNSFIDITWGITHLMNMVQVIA